MPNVHAKLALGGRHHSVFRDSLVQRSLLLRGTASIKRIEAEEIEVDRLDTKSCNLIPLNVDTYSAALNQTTADDRYLRINRNADGTLHATNKWFPNWGLQDINNVSQWVTAPTGGLQFFVWGNTPLLGNQEQFITFDVYSHAPWLLAYGPPSTRAVGDIMVYRGGYTAPEQLHLNYHWTQPDYSSIQTQLDALEARVTALESP